MLQKVWAIFFGSAESLVAVRYILVVERQSMVQFVPNFTGAVRGKVVFTLVCF